MVNQLSRPTKGAGEYRIGLEGVNGILGVSENRIPMADNLGESLFGGAAREKIAPSLSSP
jgi:hypothetical protein